MSGLGALFPPVALIAHDKENSSPCTRYVAIVGSSLPAPWACCRLRCLLRVHMCSPYHSSSPQLRLGADRDIVASRFRCQSLTVGTLSGGSVQVVTFPHISVGYR